MWCCAGHGRRVDLRPADRQGVRLHSDRHLALCASRIQMLEWNPIPQKQGLPIKSQFSSRPVGCCRSSLNSSTNLWTRTTRRDRCRKKGVRIRQLLVCAALGREWWARRQSVLSVSDPRERAARAGWRRSGAIFAFFAAVCFEPDASRARLRFKAVMRSMTGGGAAISLGLTVSPFILASISRGVSAAVHSVRPLSDRTASDGNGRQQREADRHRRCQPPEARRGGRMSTGFADISWHTGCCGVCFGTGRPARGIRTHNATRHRPLHPDFYLWHDGSCQGRGGAALGVAAVRGVYDEVWTPPAPGAGIRGVRMPAGVRAPAHTARC